MTPEKYKWGQDGLLYHYPWIFSPVSTAVI